MYSDRGAAPFTLVVMRLRHLALPVAVLALAVLSGCATPTAPAADPAPASSAAAEQPTGACGYVASPGAVREGIEQPPADPTSTGEVNATLATSAGTIKIALDADRTPCTVDSFVSLSEQKYYDNTICHRLTTAGIFVLQCGDPSASGMGGPGYRYSDELDGSETYPAGTVAMANSGPDTNGSQFFLVYEDTSLPASYTVFGHMDADSLAVVQAIAAKGVDPADTSGGGGDGAPLERVTITTSTIG